MTMPLGSTEEPTVKFTERESIPVHVVSTTARPGKNIAPEFGRFRTVTVTPTSGPQRLVARSLRRHETRIIVNAGIVNQPVIEGVLVGGRDEINAGNPAAIGTGGMGGYLQIGDNVTYKAQGELWVIAPTPANTGVVYVTVLDTQYASDPESFREEEK